MRDTAIRLTFGLTAVVWVGALFLAPLIASRPSVGTVAYLASAGIYEVGSFICHQRPERSFHLWGAQLPVCARCAGIYVGALAAVLAALAARAQKPLDGMMPRPMQALMLGAGPTILTLLFEWTTGAVPGNWTRAIAGFPLGAVVAWLVVVTSTPGRPVAIH
jgi:uncharacterized membrane protein